MTRFPASGGGSGPPYTYVMDGYPSDAEEGESLYHVTEDAAYVYTGSSWVEQTVTNHGQLAGVSEGDHRSDQSVADLAPVQSVNGNSGDVSVTLPNQTQEYGSPDGGYRFITSKDRDGQLSQGSSTDSVNEYVDGVHIYSNGGVVSGSISSPSGDLSWSSAGYYNFSARYVDTASVTAPSGDKVSIDVHIVSTEPHAHSI